MLRGDRLRKGTVKRGCVHELRPCADAALTQVPVGEERELERRDRTLDRHVDEVDDQAAAVAAAEDHNLLLAHDARRIARNECAESISRRAIVSSNSTPASIARRTGHEAATFSSRRSCSSVKSPPSSIATSNRRCVERLS